MLMLNLFYAAVVFLIESYLIIVLRPNIICLHLQVANAKKQLEFLTNQLTENNDRLDAVQNHTKNVRQELQNTKVFTCSYLDYCKMLCLNC